MARKTDIGGYFDQLTKRGTGGRRLDVQGDTSPPRSDRSGGAPSITERVRDVLVKGRDAAKRTADRARSRPRATGRSAGTGERPAGAADGAVTVEYTPRIDGDPDPGDVVWVWVPYEEDPTQGKDRPVVIIGRRHDALVGVPLTTKPDDREAQVEVGVGDWDPKRRVSYARIWRMLDVDPAAMRREGAILDRERFDRVVAAVDRHYDVRIVATTPSGSSRHQEEAPDY